MSKAEFTAIIRSSIASKCGCSPHDLVPTEIVGPETADKIRAVLTICLDHVQRHGFDCVLADAQRTKCQESMRLKVEAFRGDSSDVCAGGPTGGSRKGNRKGSSPPSPSKRWLRTKSKKQKTVYVNRHSSLADWTKSTVSNERDKKRALKDAIAMRNRERERETTSPTFGKSGGSKTRKSAKNGGGERRVKRTFTASQFRERDLKRNLAEI
jgi:hypothetical protein